MPSKQGKDSAGIHTHVRVHILKARGLIARDFSGLSDPYVVVQIGKTKHQTKPAPRTLDPEWNDQHWLMPVSPGAFYVKIGIWDHDVMGKDTTMGKLSIPIATLDTTPVNRWFPVDRSTAASATGELLMELCLSDPFDSDNENWSDEFRGRSRNYLLDDSIRVNAAALPIQRTVAFPGLAEMVEMQVCNIVRSAGGQHARGTLYITNFRLVFFKDEKTSPAELTHETEIEFMDHPLHAEAAVVSLPLGMIESIEQKEVTLTSGAAKESFVMQCTDFREVALFFPKVKTSVFDLGCIHEFWKRIRYLVKVRTVDRATRICEAVMKVYGPATNQSPLAQAIYQTDGADTHSGAEQHHTHALFDSDLKQYGWDFSMEEEFKRQQVPDTLFKGSALNKDWQLCNSYPSHLHLPSTADELMVQGSKDFRSKGRVPALTYYCKASGSSILRSSQPSPGLQGAVSLHDIALIEHCRLMSANHKSFLIVDCRSSLAARANMAKGHGTEDVSRYQYCQQKFFNIDNIHVMRLSLDTLRAHSLQHPKNFLSRLEDTRWLDHVKGVVSGAATVAYFVLINKTSVLVHCSDGWDRTAQVSALAQVLLDGYFRTFKGFKALVEKDFLAFGHKFHDRVGKDLKKPKERSPVFVQFLDSVFQVLSQFPRAFEFTQDYLVQLATYYDSGWFGTFCCNSEMERSKAGLAFNSLSLWSFLDAQADSRFANVGYNPVGYQACSNTGVHDAIWPIFDSTIFNFWKGLYMRHDNMYSNGFREFEETLKLSEQLQATDALWPGKSGYLVKQGWHLKTWRRRYFTLSNGILSYYKDAKAKKKKGQIDVRGSQVYKFAHDNQYSKFEAGKLFAIKPKACNRMYIMSASSETERSEWLDCVRQHGGGCLIDWEKQEKKKKGSNKASKKGGQHDDTMSRTALEGEEDDDEAEVEQRHSDSELFNLKSNAVEDAAVESDLLLKVAQSQVIEADLDLSDSGDSDGWQDFKIKGGSMAGGSMAGGSMAGGSMVDPASSNQLHRPGSQYISQNDSAPPTFEENSAPVFASDVQPWVLNSKFKVCMNCNVEFGMMNRRHHCRGCGGMFCQRCSNKRMYVPKVSKHPVRACQACFDRSVMVPAVLKAIQVLSDVDTDREDGDATSSGHESVSAGAAQNAKAEVLSFLQHG